MGGGGGPSITYVYIEQDALKKAVANCLDDKNCTGAVSGAQHNGYIGDGAYECGYLDRTARKLIKHAGCESFENNLGGGGGESFTAYIDNLQKKEAKEESAKTNEENQNVERKNKRQKK